MFSHVFVGVADFDRALAFYRPLMQSLGIVERFCRSDKPWPAGTAAAAPGLASWS